MLFRNRLEVWNPGHLPSFLTIPKLKKAHGSFPPNPLLAEPLYLAGFIERLGTGIPDMVKACLAAGLKEPELMQEEEFRTILWRKVQTTEQVPGEYGTSTDHVTDHVTGHVTDHVQTLILTLESVMSRLEIMKMLDLKHNQTFRENYLHPALKEKLIEMTIPDKPKSILQKYRLTKKGKILQQQLKKKKTG